MPPEARPLRRNAVWSKLVRRAKRAPLDAWMLWLLVVAGTMVVLVELNSSSISLRKEEHAIPLLKQDRMVSWKAISSGGFSFQPYFEIENKVLERAEPNPFPSNTSHSRVREIVKDANDWFTPQQICQETCCARQVLYSMDHEEHQLLNTMDGLDLADLLLRHKTPPAHLTFPGAWYHPDLLPCLQPGTIIHLNNKYYILEYFWKYIRPKIQVPFVLITSDSDRDSPLQYQGDDFGRYLNDTLLLRWYGTNPKYIMEGSNAAASPKFQPMFLGLSKKYAQAKYLEPYLEINHFQNPFASNNNERQSSPHNGSSNNNSNKEIFDLNWDVFVKFGTKRGDRLVLHRDLCAARNAAVGGRGNPRPHLFLSCNKTARVSPHEIYKQASQYTFGVSPPGLGWDCFRTYELLYLGVIPIVEVRDPESYYFFADLPIVQVPREKRKKALASNAAILQAIQEFWHQESKAPNRKLRAPGWNRLFLAYWRRKILQDAGRKTMHHATDMDTSGKKKKTKREYYMGWKYELLASAVSDATIHDVGYYCARETGCHMEDGAPSSDD